MCRKAPALIGIAKKKKKVELGPDFKIRKLLHFCPVLINFVPRPHGRSPGTRLLAAVYSNRSTPGVW